MKEEQIIDIWTILREYIDKKQLDLAAEKYVDVLADYGTSDELFRDLLGNDRYLDSAINYYLETDYENDEYDNEDE
jgi:hypothetical protein